MQRSSLGLFLLLMVPTTAVACLWDYDTLQQERSRFPDTLELITGKFPRHSSEYYEWRLEDRLARLDQEPDNLAVHDDIAVAYDKLGKHVEAIIWGEKTLAKSPERYESLANLGTFYFHAGQLEKGIPFIEKAIAINPDAHFGRERYQLWLVQYVLSRQKDGKTVLPLSVDHQTGTFADFVLAKLHAGMAEPPTLTAAERQAAVKGVLGMMRFGKFDSPILLEALASLLSHDYSQDDAKQLAARAYLMAARQVSDPAIQQAYRTRADEVLDMQTVGPNSQARLTLEALQAQFDSELRDAESYSSGIAYSERAWISDGRNPDELFQKLMVETPPFIPEPLPVDERTWLVKNLTLLGIGGLVAAAAIVSIVMFWLSGRRNEAL